MIYVSSIKLNKESIVIQNGHTRTLSATVLPLNATNRSIYWTSSNPSVASVCNGVVTAKKEGTAVIAASSTDGSQKIGLCYVRVTNDVLVTKIELDASSLNMSVGDGYMLVETVYPNNATNSVLTWESDDSMVATVDPDDGFVMARGKGKTKIRATANDGSGVSAECVVTVKAPIPVKGVEICPESVTVSTGDTYKLEAQLKPSNASDKGITWESEDESIVEVGSHTGILKAHKGGTAKITAKTHDGNFKASRSVKVNESVTIEKDGVYSKIVFSNGTVWKCNEYTCDSDSDSYTPLNHERARHNASINFSIKQLGFLFKIDPKGVIYYVKNRYIYVDMSPTEALIYRDDIYKEIYGKKPLYFTYKGSQLYYCEGVNESNRYDVYSEAELIFGMLPRWTLQNVVETVLEVAWSIITTCVPTISAAAFCFDVVTSYYFTNSFMGHVNDGVSDLLSDIFDKGEKHTLKNILGWASIVVNMFSSLLEDALPSEIDNVQIAIYENANKNDSYVIKVSDGNKIADLNEFVEHYKSLLPN